MIISINGVDGAGKSQQIKLLRFFSNSSNLFFTKPLIEYSSRWPQLKGSPMFDWWFEKVAIGEFLDIVVESLNMRCSESKNGLTVIHDRGTLMFKSVCVATMSVRTGMEVGTAIERVDILFSKQFKDNLCRERDILLQTNEEYEKSIAPFLSLQNCPSDFTEEQNRLYMRYQDLLKQAMDHYFDNNGIKRIKVDSSICDIQNELREIINSMTGLELPKICADIEQIIGFGGLSESGKSSFAESLREQGYYRLKLGYFVDIVKRFSLKDTPENVAMEFLHFCKSHYYINKFTLESLHEPYTPAFLKLLFGDKFKIIYLDAPFDVRAKRASTERGISFSEAKKQTAEKDAIKKSRGAEIVRGIADIVFDNSGDDHQDNLFQFQKML